MYIDREDFPLKNGKTYTRILLRESYREKIAKIRDEIKAMNDYLRAHPKAHVEVAIKNITERIEKLKISAFMGVVAEGRVLSLTINEDKLFEVSKLDGCYVVFLLFVITGCSTT